MIEINLSSWSLANSCMVLEFKKMVWFGRWWADRQCLKPSRGPTPIPSLNVDDTWQFFVAVATVALLSLFVGAIEFLVVQRRKTTRRLSLTVSKWYRTPFSRDVVHRVQDLNSSPTRVPFFGTWTATYGLGLYTCGLELDFQSIFTF